MWGICTHRVGVGIKGVRPLHTNYTQLHDPIPNVHLHIHNCNRLPESSGIKTTITYQQAKKMLQTRWQKYGGGHRCTAVMTTVTATAVTSVAKVMAEAAVEAAAEVGVALIKM